MQVWETCKCGIDGVLMRTGCLLCRLACCCQQQWVRFHWGWFQHVPPGRAVHSTVQDPRLLTQGNQCCGVKGDQPNAFSLQMTQTSISPKSCSCTFGAAISITLVMRHNQTSGLHDMPQEYNFSAFCFFGLSASSYLVIQKKSCSSAC